MLKWTQVEKITLETQGWDRIEMKFPFQKTEEHWKFNSEAGYFQMRIFWGFKFWQTFERFSGVH